MIYVALLRGINVGGNNLIKMSDLREWFSAAGFTNVSTFIASGNVLFEAPRGEHSKRIERMLEKHAGVPLTVVVRSRAQMKKIVDGAPKSFGSSKRRCDVLFLKEPLTGARAIKELPLKEGVDEVHAGPGVVYFSRLTSRATESRLSKVVSMPIYKQMTIRNWNTTRKLLALMG